jgi:hypothetical protein
MNLADLAWFVFLFALLPNACAGQAHDVLCNAGNSSFDATFRTGVKVSIGSQKDGEFSTRVCHGTLSWGKQKLVVASGVPQLDLDMFGVDLGSGVPVAAFTTAKSNDACCMTYQIYSLNEPPQLLRTITGGGFFEAADTDLDGKVEIWTDDSGAVDGFEGLTLGEIEFVPTYVLRLDHDRLVDASAEFQAFFDDVIKSIRARIKPELLRDFRAGDGRVQAGPDSPAQELIRLHNLRAVKIQALEIVWAYLYSGCEKEAWQSLAEMWPAGDVERIRAEILKARSRGIRSQLDGVSIGTPRKHGKKAPIFAQSEVTPPQAILRRVYPPEGQEEPVGRKEVHIELVIDSAGKVRSVKPTGETKLEQYVQISASRWKFIPAFKNDRPVAMRGRTSISPLQ